MEGRVGFVGGALRWNGSDRSVLRSCSGSCCRVAVGGGKSSFVVNRVLVETVRRRVSTTEVHCSMSSPTSASASPPAVVSNAAMASRMAALASFKSSLALTERKRTVSSKKSRLSAALAFHKSQIPSLTSASKRSKLAVVMRRRAAHKAGQATALSSTAAAAVSPIKSRRNLTRKRKKTSSSHSEASVIRQTTAPVTRIPVGESCLNSFLKEISCMELLQDEEVAHLSTRLKQLVVWEQLYDSLALSLDREPSVEEWARAAGFLDKKQFLIELEDVRRSKNTMVSSNLRLVVSIARRYENLGVSLLDLIQEGSIGLIRGVEKYDHSKGYRFATYATWWIKHFIQSALVNYSRSIRLPLRMSELVRRLRRTRTELTIEYARDPTPYELAARMELSLEKVYFVMQKATECSTVSLDSPLSEQSPSCQQQSSTLADILHDESVHPEELVVRSLLKDDLEAVLLMLSPREREIVRLRYGLEDGNSRNYEEIGSLYSVPGNRIKQIEARALRKLRHPSFNSSLREYVGST